MCSVACFVQASLKLILSLAVEEKILAFAIDTSGC